MEDYDNTANDYEADFVEGCLVDVFTKSGHEIRGARFTANDLVSNRERLLTCWVGKRCRVFPMDSIHSFEIYGDSE
jgi:hypothetical protein